MLIKKDYHIKINILNLNTSHVNVNPAEEIEKLSFNENLNTSHVNVNRNRNATKFLQYGI